MNDIAMSIINRLKQPPKNPKQSKFKVLPRFKFEKDVTVTWPENLKIKVSPTPEDTRYKFVPPNGEWVGEITKDSTEYWKDK